MKRNDQSHDPRETLLLWETWHMWHGQKWLSPVSEIDHLIDSQRRFSSMLADGDIFYSRSDLRMFIDKCRTEARMKILAAYDQTTHHILFNTEESQDLVLYAAAKLKVSPLNTMQLIKDYPDLVRKTNPKGPHGSYPLHVACATVGSHHLGRVRTFLGAFPEAVREVDEHGMLPMQAALVHGAGFDVMKLLIDAFPPALERALFSQCPVSEDHKPLIGLMPFHIACCRNCPLGVIYQLLLECPDSIKGASCSEN